MRAGVYCTEPFRVPISGKITHCLFDKTGTLTTDTLVPSGIVNASEDNSTKWETVDFVHASSGASLVLAACHSLVSDGKKHGAKITGDPIEVAALQGIGWKYDVADAVAKPTDMAELEQRASDLRAEANRLIEAEQRIKLAPAPQGLFSDGAGMRADVKAATAAREDQEKAAKAAEEAVSVEKVRRETCAVDAVKILHRFHFAAKAAEEAVSVEKVRRETCAVDAVKILHRFHFASRLQRMSVVVDVKAGDAGNAKDVGAHCTPSGQYILVKGSPEALRPLLVESSIPSWYDIAYLEMAERGRRVLAMALRQLPAPVEEADLPKLSREDAEKNLTFVGFIAFECQLRSDSGLVIGALTESGHKIAMVTGDAPLTALHVAKACGIAEKSKPALTLSPTTKSEGTGSGERLVWTVAAGERRGEPAPAESIAKLSEAYTLMTTEDALEAAGESMPELWDEMDHIRVFARMTPGGKAKVIRAIQKQGNFVLMCGDGGNDSGALKQSDTGLALLAGHGEVNTAEEEKLDSSAGSVGSEQALNQRQQELAQRAKDLSNLRSKHLKEKQRELTKLQQKWLDEEIEMRAQKGQTGFMANAAAVKALPPA
eukprot:gnl/TRDRNA2_/TRDRNA2_155465_c4_seq2.p1 gnl/TRDRNA2_/TRDRNA2_155465_c4~~gnl/TRDRNA2_/TRDRNA2_155465_c4_seq2.p1  ORF type:complete len:645 (-),score=166.92 gnl/TRDRNA2_/TRDRNA2_155465_c4_seq2:3-1805(-)